MSIREATAKDANAISTLIRKSGQNGRADFNDMGWESFIEVTSPESIRERLANPEYFTLCYMENANIVGIITMRSWTKVDQLFVDPSMLLYGIARKLWSAARETSQRNVGKRTFTVKSSTSAVPVYEKFGFKVTGECREENGVRFTPMELAL